MDHCGAFADRGKRIVLPSLGGRNPRLNILQIMRKEEAEDARPYYHSFGSRHMVFNSLLVSRSLRRQMGVCLPNHGTFQGFRSLIQTPLLNCRVTVELASRPLPSINLDKFPNNSRRFELRVMMGWLVFRPSSFT
jgi:hypothetical protein